MPNLALILQCLLLLWGLELANSTSEEMGAGPGSVYSVATGGLSSTHTFLSAVFIESTGQRHFMLLDISSEGQDHRLFGVKK